VLVEHEGEIFAQMYTARRRPCPGGYSIGHPRVTAGTLGGVVRRGKTWGYVLSNNHVLAATNSGTAGDPIYQPGVADGGGTADTIAYLEQWVRSISAEEIMKSIAPSPKSKARGKPT